MGNDCHEKSNKDQSNTGTQRLWQGTENGGLLQAVSTTKQITVSEQSQAEAREAQ